MQTLRKYINFTTPETGFNSDIIADLYLCKEFEKIVSVQFDGKLVGFCKIQSVNDEIHMSRKLYVFIF